MPDIFLSYSRDDLPTARRFAEAFEQEGYSVWWDQTLNPGEAFDEVTEKALDEAKAVVVLWSKKSVASRWVRAEATQANESRTLVPVMIEPCKRPIMFELTHTTDLSHWNGEPGDPAWQALLAGVKRISGMKSTATPSPVPALPIASAPRRLGPGALAGIVAFVVIAGAGLWMVNRGDRTSGQPAGSEVAASAAPSGNAGPATPSTSVAVLPFTNLTGDASKDFIGEGMAEELINALTRVPGLTVPSRTSSFAYQGRDADLKQIARELNVSTILEGSVRSAGEAIRITAQLIDARSDRHIWSKTYNYDREHTDLFSMQDDLAREVVTAFKTTMGANLPELQAQAAPTKDPEAYSLYLQALASMSRGSDASSRKALELLEQAVARDPTFAIAYLAMAGLRSREGYPLAEVERDARKAAELDPSLAEQVKLGFLVGGAARRSDWLSAADIYRSIPESSTRNQNNVLTELWPTGQLRKVRDEFADAYRLDPGDAANAYLLAAAESNLGLDADAIKHADAAIALGMDPAGRRIKQVYADVAVRAGRYGEAANLMVELLPERLKGAGAAEVVRLVHAALGDPAKKQAAIAGLQGLMPKVQPAEWIVRVWAMGWYAQLGALDQAYDVAEQLRKQFAVESPLNAWSWLWSPSLRAFRQDPRFQPFTERLGLMRYWQKYGPPDACDLNAGKLTCH